MEGFEQALSRFQAAVRFLALTTVVIDLATLAPRYRRPGLAIGAVSLSVGHGLWASRRLLRSGRPDARVSRTEVPLAMGLILADRLCAGGEVPQTGPRPAIDYAGNAALLYASQQPSLADAVPAIAALAVAELVAFGGEQRGRLGRYLVDLLVVTEGLIANSIVRELRQQADAIDSATARAAAEAAQRAEEQERRRQQREVHDSVLQTLELIGGGWTVDLELVEQRIDLEIDQLRSMLGDGERHLSGDLAGGLARLASEFAARNLTVHTSLAWVQDPATPGAVDALIAATRESLTNVVKHAGVDQARVVATTTDAEVVVQVIDEGIGFATGGGTAGFGVAESLRARLSEVNGSVLITSQPGIGTSVELRVPR